VKVGFRAGRAGSVRGLGSPDRSDKGAADGAGWPSWGKGVEVERAMGLRADLPVRWNRLRVVTIRCVVLGDCLFRRLGREKNGNLCGLVKVQGWPLGEDRVIEG